MNSEAKQEIDKRVRQMPELTPEQLEKLQQRLKAHREKHGKLNYTWFKGLLGLFGIGQWRQI